MSTSSFVDPSSIIASPSKLPTLLWDYYLEYLWFYEPNSWVGRIAYAFRVLAFLLVLPVTILMLLDIASYVIARTLGVVDDVRASTSDSKTAHNISPTIIVEDTSSHDTSLSSSATLAEPTFDSKDRQKLDAQDSSQPATYFASEDSRLSGVGVFSPAASRPPSPTITRRNLPGQELWNLPDGIVSHHNGDLGALRRRTAGEAVQE